MQPWEVEVAGLPFGRKGHGSLHRIAHGGEGGLRVERDPSALAGLAGRLDWLDWPGWVPTGTGGIAGLSPANPPAHRLVQRPTS